MKAFWSLLILSLILCVPFAKTQEETTQEDMPLPDEHYEIPPEMTPDRENYELPEQFTSDEMLPEEPIDESAVLELTEATFENAIKENKYILVEFYAPWCQHCKQLAPEYALAAQSLLNRTTPVILAKVDGTAETALSTKFEVQGYPTIKFFMDGGEPVDYTGPRTTWDIITWVEKRLSPIVQEVNNLEELEILKETNPMIVVLFGESGENDANIAFRKIAVEFDYNIPFIMASEPLRAQVNHELNSLVVYKQYDEKVAECNCEVNEENIRNFVDRHQFPLVINFDYRAAEKIFGEGRATFFFLVKSEEEQDNSTRQVFSEVADLLRGKLLFSVSYLSEDLGQKLAEYIGLAESELPAIKILSPTPETGEVKKYNFEGVPTVEALVQFYEDFSNGNLQPYYRSEPVPESNDGPVKVVVGKNFNEIVMDPTKDVLLEFYAPWCGHCQELAPIYENVAKRFQENTGLLLAKCDATANEIEGVAIEGFPTIKLYPANSKEVPVEYPHDAPRTEEKIVEFLMTHVTVPLVDAPKKEDL